VFSFLEGKWQRKTAEKKKVKRSLSCKAGGEEERVVFSGRVKKAAGSMGERPGYQVDHHGKNRYKPD